MSKNKLINVFVFIVLITFIPSVMGATVYYDPTSDVQTGWGCTGTDCGIGQYAVLDEGVRTPSAPSITTDYISQASNVAGVSEHQTNTVSETGINYVTLWVYASTGGNHQINLVLENNGASVQTGSIPTGQSAGWFSITWNNPTSVGDLSAVFSSSRVGGGGPTEGYVYAWYIEINYDTAPYYTNPLANPESPINYDSSQNYQFNTTWNSESAIDNVVIEHNFTGTLSNYSVSNNGNLYYYNYGSLPAGNYVWRYYASNVQGLINQTPQYSYLVNKVESVVNLTLDNLPNNISVESGDFVNISAEIIIGESVINLYNNGTLINQGSGLIYNYTQFIIPGIYNITVEYPQTQNYTGAYKTLFVNVTDTLAPNTNIDSITPNPSQFGVQNVSVLWSVSDYNLDDYFANITYPNGSLLGVFHNDFQVNITELTVLGFYKISIFANDTSGNFDADTEFLQVRDTLAPTYSNIVETPAEPINYSEVQNYEFNITWADKHSIDSVWLVFDGITYTDVTNESGVFSKQFGSLSAATYTYTWYANDSSGNTANTGALTYTINKAVSQVNLTLNGINNNLTINSGDFVEINVTSITPNNGYIELLRGASIIQTGTGLINNYSTHPAGYYNIVGRYPQTQNYTFSSMNYYLRVNAYPVTTLTNPPNMHTDVDGNFSLSCGATDAEGLTSITLYHNISQPFGANRTVLVGGTSASVTFNLTNVLDGYYSWNCLSTDIYGATDFANSNRTIIVDSSADQPPIPHLEYPEDDFYDNTANITFNCSADDLEGLANITLWWDVNGSFVRNETKNVGGIHNSSLFERNNIPEGSYNWACEAGDTFGQSAITNNRTFTIDKTPPSISLYYPSNNINITSGYSIFNYTAVDNNDLSFYCNLSINSLVENSSLVYNNTLFETIISFSDGLKYWNVSCVDRAGNVNTSITRFFYVYTINVTKDLMIYLDSDNLTTIINWTVNPKAQYYNIYITNNYSLGFNVSPTITGVTDNNFTDLNSPNYEKRFYRVSSVNGGAENMSEYSVGKVGPITLTNGFNLVSIPFNITMFDLKNNTNNGHTFSTNIFDCVDSIFRWNGSLFEETVNEGNQVWLPAIGSESFTKLEIGRSYWLNTNTECNITYLGIVPQNNFSRQLNNPFYLGGWYSPHKTLLGEVSSLGNPLISEPQNNLLRVYRYNSQGSSFEGVRWFSGYGWWQMFDSQDFTSLDPGKGYYFSINPTITWTHNPEFSNE